jgi:hypothetical protein
VSVALVVVTDGRAEYLGRAISSLEEQLTPYPTYRYLVDDSGDERYNDLVHGTYGGRFGVFSHFGRLGFVATVADAWGLAVQDPSVEYVFHAEDDFTYNVPVDLERMGAILDDNPDLAQLALKRQPVNYDERTAGDLFAAHPANTWEQWPGFIEHSLTFTTNPCLIPRRVIQIVLRHGVPTAEVALTHFLREHGYRLAYLGEIGDSPRVHHIGDERSPGAVYG